MTQPSLDFAGGARRLRTLAEGFARMAASVSDEHRTRFLPATPEWTPHDLLAHVADLTHRYAAGYRNEDRFAPSFDVLSEWTGEAAAPYRERPYDDLVSLIASVAEPLESAALAVGPDHLFDWHADAPIPVRGGVGIAINELLVHGWDLASGTGKAWPLTPDDVSAGMGLALHGLEPVIAPSAAGHTATYELRIRGGDRMVLILENGKPRVGTPDQDPTDVVLAAPAATLLLTMYRRKPLWWTVTVGQALAWGRKPWLALSLTEKFRPF